MIDFQESAPRESRQRSLPVIRTPARAKLHACITSNKLIGCNTHFWGGHTVPCTKPACEACDAGVVYRWHGYVSGIVKGTHEHILMEFTAQACDVFDAFTEKHGSIRGAEIIASRRPASHNGRVMISIRPADLTNVVLPEGPDLREQLCHLWNIPLEVNEEESFAHKPARVAAKVRTEENGFDKGNENTTVPRFQHTR